MLSSFLSKFYSDHSLCQHFHTVLSYPSSTSSPPELSLVGVLHSVYWRSLDNGSAPQGRTTSGIIHVDDLPVLIQWRGGWKVFSFDAISIFHDKLADLTTHVSLLRSYAHGLLIHDSLCMRNISLLYTRIRQYICVQTVFSIGRWIERPIVHWLSSIQN